jgi:hypothetical protein
MLNFNTTIQEVLNTQTTTNNTVKQFTEYNSKKKLLESKILQESVCTFITQLKNTFTFYVHNTTQYIVIVMYYSTTKSYGFYVLDTTTLKMAQVESVKTGKQGVLELLNTQNNTTK